MTNMKYVIIAGLVFYALTMAVAISTWSAEPSMGTTPDKGFEAMISIACPARPGRPIMVHVNREEAALNAILLGSGRMSPEAFGKFLSKDAPEDAKMRLRGILTRCFGVEG